MNPPPAMSERERRWRLVLGASAEERSEGACPGLRALDAADLAMDRALAALYESDRSGGLGSSCPNVARWLGVRADEIVFASGATAALNIVAQSWTRLLSPGDEILLTELEHHSNIVPWQLAAERAGLVIRGIPATPEGRLDLDALPRLVGPRTRIIAATHVSNVTGAVTDVDALVAAARGVGARVLLDGSQRAPHGPVDVPSLGVDFYVLTGHKMHGPSGIGALWARRAILESMPPFPGGYNDASDIDALLDGLGEVARRLC